MVRTSASAGRSSAAAGAGRWASACNSALQNVEVVAVWTRGRGPRSCRRRGEEGHPKRSEQLIDYQDVLALKEVDAVLISTPDHQHRTELIEPSTPARTPCRKADGHGDEGTHRGRGHGEQERPRGAGRHAGAKLAPAGWARLRGLRRARQDHQDRTVPQRLPALLARHRRRARSTKPTWTGRRS